MNIFYVKPKKAPSKGVLNTTEKCPHCLVGFVDFMDVGRTIGLQNGVLLGCYTCGGVFVSLDACASERGGKGEMLESQDIVVGKIGEDVKKGETVQIIPTKEIGSQIAKCGKLIPEGKSLAAHERSCKKCKAME